MAFSGSVVSGGGYTTHLQLVMSSGMGTAPTIMFGHVPSGGLYLSSGAFASGVLIESQYPCDQCDVSTKFSKLIRVRDSYYCHTCASYDPKEGFTRRAEDILRSVPCHDAPWSVIADWLEDNERASDAAWVRNNRC